MECRIMVVYPFSTVDILMYYLCAKLSKLSQRSDSDTKNAVKFVLTKLRALLKCRPR